MHHTKNKGDLGVLKVMADLCARGFMVLVPQTEHAQFDLVAYQDGVFQRVQVKYRSMKNGTIVVSAGTSWADRFGSHSKNYDADDFDIFAVYCPETDKCYYVAWDGCFKDLALRIKPTKNNQSLYVNFASDYEHVPWPRSSVGIEQLTSNHQAGGSNPSEVANSNISIH